MNRLKFRAWDSIDNKMIYPSDEVYNGLPVIGLNGILSMTRFDSKKDDLIWDKNEPGMHSWIDYSDWYGIDYMRLMESTGLKDKTGILIYEKDIVKKDIGSYTIDLHTGKKEHCEEGIFTIKYNQLHCCFGLFKEGSYVEGIIADQYDSEGKTNKEWICESIEVIGNIYENNELLTGEE